MATIYDAVEEVVTLITTQWVSANTSNKTPNIGKISDYPFSLQFGDGIGYVLFYSINENEDIPGLGLDTNARVDETIKIDIRITEEETYFKEIKAEIRRILYVNRVTGTPNYCNFDLDNKQIQNLSNRMKKVFREVREFGITQHNRDMTQ